MLTIWFNPELNQYQYGSKSLFEKQKGQSQSPDAFKMLYEFNHTSERLVDKVYQALLTDSQEFSPAISSK